MTQKEIAKQFRVSESTISQLISDKDARHKRYTQNVSLAIALAQREGTKPIQYINPSMRQLFLRAYPELSRKFK